MDPRPENVKQPKEAANTTDWKEYCQSLDRKGCHRELLEGLVTLVGSIEKAAEGDAQPTQMADICDNIENIFSVLSVPRPPSQPPPLRSESKNALDLRTQLAAVEDNLVRAIGFVSYDILTAIGDLRCQVAVLQPHVPRTVVDPACPKELSIAEFARFMRQAPRKCDCSAAPRPQPDRRVHFASAAPFYEVCPIQVTFGRFEAASDVVVVVNFAAAASYTNFVSSIFAPKERFRAQIPLMGMPNVLVLGEVAAEMQFSEAAAPVTFSMNVIAVHGDRTVILGRDFVDAYVQSVRHDARIVTLKDSRAKRTFDKRFVYLRDVEMTFTRGSSKKEANDDLQAGADPLQRDVNVDNLQAGADPLQGEVNVDNLQARLDRLQRVLGQRSTSDRAAPMASDAHHNAKSSDANSKDGVDVVSDRSHLQPSSEPMISQTDLPAQAAGKAVKATVEKPDDGPKTSSQSANVNREIVSGAEKPSDPSHVIAELSNVASLADWDKLLKDMISDLQSKTGALKKIKKSVVENSLDLEKFAEMESQDRVDSKDLRTDGVAASASSARPVACRMQRPKPYEREPSHRVSETAAKVENAEKNALDATRTRPPVVTKKGSSESVDSSSQCDENEALDSKKPDLPEEVEIESSSQSGNGDPQTATSRDSSEGLIPKETSSLSEPSSEGSIPKETSPLSEPEKRPTTTPKCQQKDNCKTVKTK